MKNSLCSRLFLFLLAWILCPGLLVAASTVEFIDDQAIKESLNVISQKIEDATSEEQLDLIRQELPKHKSKITECKTNTKNQIEKVSKDLETIGQTATGIETKDIIDTREDLSIALGELKSKSLSCNELETQVDELIDQTVQKIREVTAQYLSQRSYTILESIEALPHDIPVMITDTAQTLNIATPPARSSFSNWLFGLFMGGLGIGLGFIGQYYLRNWLSDRKGPGGNEAFEFNLVNSIASQLPWIIGGTVGALAFNNINPDPDSFNFSTRLMMILAVFAVANFVFIWLCKANSPGDTLHSLNKAIPKALVKRLRITAIITAIGFAIFGTQWLQKLPESGFKLPYQVINISLAISLLSILQLAGKFTDLKGRYRFIRIILILASALSVIANLLGYINAANYLLFASLMTMVAGLILWVLIWSLDQTVDGIINGKSKTSYKLRASLGIRAEETSRELGWLSLLSGLGLWTAFSLFLLYLWDFTDSSIPAVKLLATDGFQIGEDTNIVPKNILIGLIVFAIILSISVWLKAKLERTWLRNIGMDRGSRDAVVTLTGYMGMIIAVLMGLTAAGVSFTGLALVAGALSVGIGFGLQNIVNNFISGLILLFERPIHSGDYISVGSVEGTVKRISIRSTEIETMQRTSVIVPNSELISGQVTNWVLHDAFGTVKVPVGVAYGSDTELVKKILLEVTHAHPEIVARPNLQQPTVRFLGFGDSSLNFTVVALVKNITKRFDIISDLNFAIDAALRKNNIEIPFPQRDLHIKSSYQADTIMPEFLKPRNEEIVEKPSDNKE